MNNVYTWIIGENVMIYMYTWIMGEYDTMYIKFELKEKKLEL